MRVRVRVCTAGPHLGAFRGSWFCPQHCAAWPRGRGGRAGSCLDSDQGRWIRLWPGVHDPERLGLCRKHVSGKPHGLPGGGPHYPCRSETEASGQPASEAGIHRQPPAPARHSPACRHSPVCGSQALWVAPWLLPLTPVQEDSGADGTRPPLATGALPSPWLGKRNRICIQGLGDRCGKHPMWPPRDWGHVTKGGVGTAGPWKSPAALMPSPGFAGSPPQPCAARGRTHGPQGLPWVLGGAVGLLLRTRGSDDAPQAPVPSAGSPSLLEDTPEPRALACPGVPAADGDGTRPPELRLRPAQQDS